jgi:hypothetical protein
MKYAKQLNIDPGYLYNQRKTRVVGKHVLGKHGKIEGVDDYSTIRRYIPRVQAELFKEVLPPTIVPFISGVTMTEITLLAPHVHTKEMCVINFYQRTHGDITSFYEGEIEPDDSWTQDNGNGYFLANPRKLTECEKFVAQDGDVWLLNTRQPHSLDKADDARIGNDKYKPARGEKRVLVQAFFDLPFEEVAGFFND